MFSKEIKIGFAESIRKILLKPPHTSLKRLTLKIKNDIRYSDSVSPESCLLSGPLLMSEMRRIILLGTKVELKRT